MNNIIETMLVDKIEDQGDRILLYKKEGKRSDLIFGPYYVIANPKDVTNIEVGDTIVYEGIGINFGKFRGKAK